MRAFIISLALIFCLLPTVAVPAHAAISSDQFEHAKSAMQFADKRDWSNALSHARRSDSPAMVKLITWEYILDADSGASFDEITKFIEANPEWPEQKRLHIRAEQSLKNSTPPDNEVVAWFDASIPVTGVGKLALAEAYMHSKLATEDKITYLLRDAWRNGDFEEPQEKQFLASYSVKMRKEDEISRIDRLLWEEKTSLAKRVLNRVPSDYQKLYKARIALIENKSLSVLAVAQVPSSLKNDPGLIYDRMRYRARRDDSKGVREMLLAAPAHVPYPEKWWRMREQQVREAIDEKNYTMAKKLLANHGQVDGVELADAMWIQGWLLCEFMDDPKKAYDIFYRMYSAVRFPVSKARAAYWAARAAEKSDDKNTADNWYNTASAYPTTYYGQLASFRHNGTAPLHIPAQPSVSDSERAGFDRHDLTQAAQLCIELKSMDLASRLIGHMVETAKDDTEAALASELGRRAGRIYLSVRGAKKAMQGNVVLIDAGYPVPKTPDGLAVERPLALAVTRQESEYDPMAKSPSGAMGLMQMLPRSAKEIARKHSIGFTTGRLYEEDYNFKLGSLYLQRLVSSYDGSYIMAIAAYNGGPGNVHRWTGQFSTPGKNIDNAVDWIEKIPFAETRNYVQRVMENLQVYRHIESDGGSARLQIGEDLTR